MQATAVAHPNIALVKYWGKLDADLNLPAMGSLSVTLDTLTTTTRVRFDGDLDEDRFALDGKLDRRGQGRVTRCLDLVRERAGVSWRAEVSSSNSFPTAAGLASSASGFAALVVAADRALEAHLDPSTLADFARRASGSAARSLAGGFVELALDEAARTTHVVQLAAPDAWPLEVIVAVTALEEKEVGSSGGMASSAATSPFYPAWVSGAGDDLSAARAAVLERDFWALTEVSERSCLKMHAVMLSSSPALLYWNGTTVACLHVIRKLRADGVPVFFTVDAGPQVKAVCLPGAAGRVEEALTAVPGVLSVLTAGLGGGARVADDAP